MKTFNIFGDIIGGETERWYESEVTPKQIVDFLADAKGEAVEFNINSYGGSVTGGLAICNAIKKYPGETTCNVLGIAASMASAIACAAKSIKMGEGSFLMIHNPWTYTSGNAEELRKDADTLDKMRDSILGFYMSKNTKTADEVKGYMDEETWIPREEAADYGFTVEDYGGELRAAASLTRRAYDKAPEAARALMEYHDKAPERNAPQGATGGDNWEARFKGLSKKFNDLKAASEADKTAQADEFKAQIAAITAERDDFKSKLEASEKDLTDAKAKVSELSAKLEESENALQKATADLAETRDSLKAAEDKAAQLENTRDLLTAGVLTPPEVGSTYAEKMKAATTAAEREKLRAQKRAGKIK
jgi:ATP-dependent Clp protease protease subunit